MEFANIPHDKLNKNNPDYDMELFWYGFKNLIKNYFSNIEDNGYIFSKEIDKFSESLNDLQKEGKYTDINQNIYLFLKKFLKASFDTLIHYTPGVVSYLLTWLKRYNKIKESVKLELPNQYNKKKNLENLTEDETILIKLKIFEVCMDKYYDFNLIKIFDTNKEKFIQECIDNYYPSIFDYISLRFNIDEYYKNLNINVKGPIKLNKILKLS
jgi:hypothetical protein